MKTLIRMTLVCCAFVTLAAGGAAEGKTKTQALEQMRVKAASDTLAAVTAAWKVGRGSAEVIYTWSVRLVDAERARSTSRRKRAASLSRHLQRMRTLETDAGTRFRTGQVAKSQVSAAKYYRVEAELWKAHADRKRK